jgi:Phage terminase large subunit (GpA)
MSDSLGKIFLQSIQSGLNRKAIHSCSVWAEKYRVLNAPPYPGKWSFKYFPWLKDMHDSEAELNCGMKAAQVGFTETVLNVAFYNIDIKNRDVLYILPARTPDASDFSSARFDAALESSEHLEQLFSDRKNLGHKRAGSRNLYIRGSRSRGGLKSVPVGLIVLDELEEMSAKAIPLVLERTSGQLEHQTWMVSTPTLEGRGISKYYNESSANHFFIRCPSCNRFIELKYPENIEFNIENSEKSRLLCNLCKNTLKHEEKVSWLANNQWVETHTNREVKGWHVNQLYSTTVSPADLTQSYIRGTNDLTDETEFYNSKLGIPHEVSGARVTEEEINRAKGNYKNREIRTFGCTTMGVDIGNPWIHLQINEWFFNSNVSTDINTHAKAKVLYFGKIRHFFELDNFMKEYQVNFCVIDSSPERRLAYEFACRFWGKVRLCFYVVGIQGKAVHLADDMEPKISVDRTSWLDQTLGRFRNGTLQIPNDIDEEYRGHIKALVRVYDKDKFGNPIGLYSNGNFPDHYAHAANYCEIALPLAVSIGRSQTLSGSII